MSILGASIATLDGTPTTLADLAGGKPALLVNVASKCGLTPQYEGLERIAKANPGLAVIGFPCNQFLGQEPGTAEEIAEFCSVTYGVSFPLTEKIDVNGENRHPIFATLTEAPEQSSGEAGDVTWNFEKFLIDAEGTVVARFSPRTEPEDAAVLAAIAALV